MKSDLISINTFEELIKEAKTKSIWDLGNLQIYNLFKNNLSHITEEEIVAKVWILGRAYSASIERRKNKKETNNDFYKNKIIPVFKNINLDNFISKILLYNHLNIDSIKEISTILKLHYNLQEAIRNNLTKDNKRSFCSKYLHFHCPNSFFIYDSRAVKSLNLIKPHLNKKSYKELKNKINNKIGGTYDDEYKNFFINCLVIREMIETSSNTKITIREFDTILLNIANEQERKTLIKK